MSLPDPRWVDTRLAQAVHTRQLMEHGGSTGLRDRSALESALARPPQRLAYGGSDVDLPALAAAYAFGLARNHPFVDGNKRTAYVVARTFLVLNGWDLVGPLAERYPIFLGIASGEIDEAALANWLRDHARPQSVSEPIEPYRR